VGNDSVTTHPAIEKMKNKKSETRNLK